MLLGAVGAYDWNGTVVMQTAESTITPEKDEFYDPKDNKTGRGLAEYLGESKPIHHTCRDNDESKNQ